MKFFLSISTALAIVMCNSLFSEIIITKDNMGLKASNETKIATYQQTEVTTPTLGENQIWDLTNLPGDMVIMSDTTFDATNDQNYPDALYYFKSDYELSAFAFSSHDYVGLDEAGFYKIGRVFDEQNYPLTDLTGNSEDNLVIVGGKNEFDGRFDYVQFPLKYGNTWTQTYKINTNYKLTLTSYGLNSVPGLFQSIETHSREVVGSGTVKIKNSQGGTLSIEALLIKDNVTRVDSTFLAGMPAPSQLMAAFGITQGNTVSAETYNFYAPGYGQSIAYYNGNGYIGYTILDETQSDVNPIKANELNIYPNPVKAGSDISIVNTENNISQFRLVDQGGKEIMSYDVNMNTNRITIPSYLSKGAYLLQSIDKQGKPLSTNKIIIE